MGLNETNHEHICYKKSSLDQMIYMESSQCTDYTAMTFEWQKAIMQILIELFKSLHRKKHVKQQIFSCSWRYCGCRWAVLFFTYIMGAQIIQKSRRNLKILSPEMLHKANSIFRHAPTKFCHLGLCTPDIVIRWKIYSMWNETEQ